MSTNYPDAAHRHWRDAAYLEGDERWFNADQLYGLAAECALKAVMAALGAPASPGGDLLGTWSHVDSLWNEYQVFAAGRNRSRYLAPLGGFAGNPFSDWSISQRYAPDSEKPGGAALIQHAKASKACQVVLQRVREDIGI